MKTPTFADFAEKIRALPRTQLQESDCLGLLLADEGTARVYYAPFDWINRNAKIAIVGITPGKASMLNGLHAAATGLREGRTFEECSKLGKQMGSFSNMRTALCEMLNVLNIPEILDIPKAEDLFGQRADLLHTTSCVRHPVFVWNQKSQRWVNYTGHNPNLLKWNISRSYIENVLAEELRQIPGALIVPCGEAVDGALRHLCAIGLLDPERCLSGFPHASGANGHRVRFFNQRREQLAKAASDWANRRSVR